MDKVSELEKFNEKHVETGSNGDNEEVYVRRPSPFQRQTVVSLGTFMLTLGAGATAGFSAVLIPQLNKDKDDKSKYSTEIISWVAAMSCLALVFGNLISGYIMERFGRRASQIMLSIPFMLGWVTIALASDIYFILIGRFVTGLCQGWLGPLGPVFVGEISSPIYRGFFLASLSLAIAMGVLMSHLFGTFLHWKIAALLCGMFPMIGCGILYFAPDSPSWLASKNRIEECVTSFQWYRGKSVEMQSELNNMISEQTMKVKENGKIETLKANMSKPEFWKPLNIMVTFFIITQLSGVNVICAYTTDMMQGLMGTKDYAYTAMLSIDVLRCVCLSIACVLLRRLGRRPMAIISSIFTSLSMILLGIYLYLVDRNVVNLSPIISLGLIVIYMIVSNMGIVPLPWNMVGELFATETKGIGSGISVMMTSIAFFGTVKTAPAMFHGIGYHGTYLFYGLATLIGTIYLFFYLPETKNKTLLQIEEYFRYGKSGRTKDFSRNASVI